MALACVASVSVWFRSRRKTEERDFHVIFGFGRAKNGTRAKKMKRGEGEGKEGRFPSFLSHPLLAILLAPFESPSSFFAPKPHRNACYAG